MTLADINTSEIYLSDGKTGRGYHVGEHVYPSATTVLSIRTSQEFQEWLDAVGPEVADEYSKRATKKGTNVHKAMEDYINGLPIYPSKMSFTEKDGFEKLKRLVDDHLGKVYAQEAPLYSHRIRMAGRVDLIGDWDGEPSIIDFKTSKDPKTEDKVESYFIQETAYSVMFEDLSGRKIRRIVTLLAPEFDGSQVFERDPRDYYKKLKDVRMRFYEEYGI